MKSKITLKELARLLQVSVSTVSKALNDSPEISEKTIQRVKELAAMHNYRPNPTAVNLKSSRSGTVAVVVPSISNSFFAKVMAGMEKEAQRQGVQVITYISNESYEREKEIMDMVSSGIVDGVLISPSEETQRKREYGHIKELLEYGLPVVLYDRINMDIPVDKIGVNDVKSMREAVDFFVKRDLKKIGLISAIHHLDVGKKRIAGYQEAMGEAQLEEKIVKTSRLGKLRNDINSLLREGVESVICIDLIGTLLTTRIAHEQQIKIPEQLKILGYVNEDVAPYLWPSLSYIDQHPMKMGEKAIQLLQERINKKGGKLEPSLNLFHTEMVHLESTKF